MGPQPPEHRQWQWIVWAGQELRYNRRAHMASTRSHYEHSQALEPAPPGRASATASSASVCECREGNLPGRRRPYRLPRPPRAPPRPHTPPTHAPLLNQSPVTCRTRPTHLWREIKGGEAAAARNGGDRLFTVPRRDNPPELPDTVPLFQHLQHY